MGTAERRKETLALLCRRRHDTTSNLASEFCVSERTIRRDIEALSLTEPIYTQTGRYGGGIYVLDGYYIDRMYMTEQELEVLRKAMKVTMMYNALSVEEIKILKCIIDKYTKPKIKLDVKI